MDAAKIAIKNRIKDKETMFDFILKKREMFLFQMMINCKREQINNFEDKVKLKQLGLVNNEKILERDLEYFNEYLEQNKNRARNAMKTAEDEMKLK